jgi:hypothetical protein
MLSYVDDEATVKERFFGRIEEIWELDYAEENVPMFRVEMGQERPERGPVFHHHGYT